MIEHELLPEIRYGLAADREATVTPRSIGIALIAGGALGLTTSIQQPHLNLRERLFAAGGGAASVGLGLLAVAAPMSISGPARRAPVLFSAACYGGAVSSTVLGGGHQTPAYFPAVLLTALGGGIGGDVRTGRRGGVAVALGYLAGCAGTLKPWRSPLSREAWWNPAGALGFVGAGVVGAIAGDLTLKTRALTDYVERERIGPGRDRIEEAATDVRHQGREFLRLLPKVADIFSHEPSVKEVTHEFATALGSLGTVRAMDVSDNRVALGTWQRLQTVIESYDAGDGNAQVSLRTSNSPPPSTSAAATGVLCDNATALIQNSANAREGRPSSVAVDVSLALQRKGRRQVLRMAVEDDAGGRRVPRSQWGKGLSECQASAEELGGAFWLEDGRAGLRAVTELPYVSAPNAGYQALTFTSQSADGREAALRALRYVTGVQAAFIALSVSERDRLPKRATVIALLLGAGEFAQKLEGRRRARVVAALGTVAMSAVRGPGRPPLGGWSAVMCAQAASSGYLPEAWAGAAMATIGATASAGPERFGSGLPVTIGDRTFALIGAGVGVGIWRGIRRLKAQEEHVASEAWRRQILAELATPGRVKHHLLDPLERAIGPEKWEQFSRTELGSQLVGVKGKDLRFAQKQLEGLLSEGDPLRELQHQLARLLAPAPVRIFGELPKRTAPRQGQELDAVRYRLGLIGLGQAIAERVRSYLPTSLFFRQQLQELQIHVSPGYERTRLTIVQVPFQASRQDRVDAIVDVASHRAGGEAKPSGSDRFDVFVHNTALG